MLIEQISIGGLEYSSQNNHSFSIHKDTVVINDSDGREIARNRTTCAFMPDELEKLKIYTGVSSGPLIDYIQSVWTPQVIADFLDFKAQAMNN